MNRLMIIGNLTKDPELRSVSGGISVCSFGVAVNRRNSRDGAQQADYFSISAWRELGEVCAKYLSKGKKVCVVGEVSVRTYQTQQGEFRASLEVLARDVEFLSPRSDPESGQASFTQVTPDDLPWD